MWGVATQIKFVGKELVHQSFDSEFIEPIRLMVLRWRNLVTAKWRAVRKCFVVLEVATGVINLKSYWELLKAKIMVKPTRKVC